MKIGDIYFFIKGYLQAKKGVSLSEQSILDFQKKRFKCLSNKLLNSSPYYMKLKCKEINGFPIINKKIHMDNFDEINTKGLDRARALDIAIESEKTRDFNPDYNGYSVGLSSGTSGNRGLFVLSAKERSQWAGYIIGKMIPFKLKRQKVAFILRANNKLYEASNGFFLKFKFFDLLNGIEKNVKLLSEFSPSILVAPASVLKRISESDIDISPDRVISVAEVLDAADKSAIEKKFKVNVEQIYQCTEGFLAASCKEGGIHLNEDAYIIEKKWVDRRSGRFSPIVTDLNRSIQPVVRYLLDDILILNPDPCDCGSSMTRIEAIEGRCDDVISLNSLDKKKIEIFPDFVRNSIISSADKIENYRLIQKTEHILEVGISPYTEEVIQKIDASLDLLWKRLSAIPPQCEYVQYKEDKLGKKQRRVVREYNG